MIYGPDDKPIVPKYAKSLKSVTESWYTRSVLKLLEDKFRFTDYWGPRLYDASGNQIEWPGRPMVPVKTGRTIQFFRKMETYGCSDRSGRGSWLQGRRDEGRSDSR